MIKVSGTYLVDGAVMFPMKYQVMGSLLDFDRECRCVVVPNLSSDYYIILGLIDFIVTERGGALSHLAIIGREYGVPIFLAPDIISKIPPKGELSIKNNVLETIEAGRNSGL